MINERPEMKRTWFQAQIKKAIAISAQSEHEWHSTHKRGSYIALLQKKAIHKCWQIKDVSTYDPQAYRPTPFSPRDSQGSCQSAEQGDYNRLIYLYQLATQTLTMIELENN
jgi:hypothetical protein